MKVVLRQGLVNQPHFAHFPSNRPDKCLVEKTSFTPGAPHHNAESIDHILAKHRLADAERLVLDKECKTCTVHSKAQAFTISHAVTEHSISVFDQAFVLDVFVKAVLTDDTPSTPSTPSPSDTQASAISTSNAIEQSIALEVFKTHAIGAKYDVLSKVMLVFELYADDVLAAANLRNVLTDKTTWQCDDCQHREQQILQDLKTLQATRSAYPQPIRQQRPQVRHYGSSLNSHTTSAERRAAHRALKETLELLLREVNNNDCRRNAFAESKQHAAVCSIDNSTSYPYLESCENMELDIAFNDKDYAKREYCCDDYKLWFDYDLKGWYPYDREERECISYHTRPQQIPVWFEFSFMSRVYVKVSPEALKRAKQAGMFSCKQDDGTWQNYFKGPTAAELARTFGKGCTRVNLCIPYEQRNKAKRLQQIYWDNSLKTWYACSHMKMVCQRWAYGYPARLHDELSFLELDEPTEYKDQEAVEQQEKHFVQQLLGNDFVIR